MSEQRLEHHTYAPIAERATLVREGQLNEFRPRTLRAQCDEKTRDAGKTTCLGDIEGTPCEISWRWAHVSGIVAIADMMNIRSNLVVDRESETRPAAPASARVLVSFIHNTGWQRTVLQAIEAPEGQFESNLHSGSPKPKPI